MTRDPAPRAAHLPPESALHDQTERLLKRAFRYGTNHERHVALYRFLQCRNVGAVATEALPSLGPDAWAVTLADAATVERARAALAEAGARDVLDGATPGDEGAPRLPVLAFSLGPDAP